MFDEILYPYTDYNCTDLTLNLSDMILKFDVKCCPNKYDKYNDVIYGVFPYVTQPENDTSINHWWPVSSYDIYNPHWKKKKEKKIHSVLIVR